MFPNKSLARGRLDTNSAGQHLPVCIVCLTRAKIQKKMPSDEEVFVASGGVMKNAERVVCKKNRLFSASTAHLTRT